MLGDFTMSESIPRTRAEAIALLQKLGWNDGELSPDERKAIRKLYGLDEMVPLPAGARYIVSAECPGKALNNGTIRNENKKEAV